MIKKKKKKKSRTQGCYIAKLENLMPKTYTMMVKKKKTFLKRKKI